MYENTVIINPDRCGPGNSLPAMKKHFPILIEQDSDGYFIVECPVLKGCRSYGETMEEALRNIREAIELCMEEDAPDEDLPFMGMRDLEVSIS